MAWQARSRRRGELPRNWRALRRQVLERDRHTCQQCGARANHVDHIDHRGPHTLDNLTALCQTCHMRKTQADGHQARQRARRAALAKARRPKPRHPGLA